MRRDMFTIIKKEFARFFGDKAMVFSTVLLPGLLIYVLYSFMGEGMMNELHSDDTHVANAYVQNMPDELAPVFTQLSAEWTEVADDEIEGIKEQIANKEADVLVVFPENFAGEIEGYDVTSGALAPNVGVYYNATAVNSDSFSDVIIAILESYEDSKANLFDVNRRDPADESVTYNMASDKDATGMIFAMMMPLLIMTFLFSGCVSIAPESIAGEKERGTIATLLVTPMKRSALALGKIVSLSVISLLAGLSSFIGTMLALPKLMGAEAAGVNTAVYGVTDYLLLLGIILTTVMVLVSAVSLISAFSKSIKAASTAATPLMIVVMVVSVLPMMGAGSKSLPTFLIPLYNSVQSMDGIFSFSYEPMQMVLTMVSNVVVAGVLTVVLTKLFNNENVMFAK